MRNAIIVLLIGRLENHLNEEIMRKNILGDFVIQFEEFLEIIPYSAFLQVHCRMFLLHVL
jgi:hypothetical protein